MKASKPILGKKEEKEKFVVENFPANSESKHAKLDENWKKFTCEVPRQDLCFACKPLRARRWRRYQSWLSEKS